MPCPFYQVFTFSITAGTKLPATQFLSLISKFSYECHRVLPSIFCQDKSCLFSEDLSRFWVIFYPLIFLWYRAIGSLLKFTFIRTSHHEQLQWRYAVYLIHNKAEAATLLPMFSLFRFHHFDFRDLFLMSSQLLIHTASQYLMGISKFQILLTIEISYYIFWSLNEFLIFIIFH